MRDIPQSLCRLLEGASCTVRESAGSPVQRYRGLPGVIVRVYPEEGAWTTDSGVLIDVVFADGNMGAFDPDELKLNETKLQTA